MNRLVLLTEIWRMLACCAEGFVARRAVHYFRVSVRGKVYSTLPTGAHGKKSGQAEIEIGHVRSMARALGLDRDCVNGFFPGLVK